MFILTDRSEETLAKTRHLGLSARCFRAHLAFWLKGFGSHKDNLITFRRRGRGWFFWGRWRRFGRCRFWSDSTGKEVGKEAQGEENEGSMQRREEHTRNQNCSGQGCVGGDVSVYQSFPTWRRRVGRGLVHLRRFAVKGSTSHYHIVVPRK